MNAESLLSKFESIGDTCEFGFVQRRAGHEGVSLLRWFSLSMKSIASGDDLACLQMLKRAVREKFHALDDPEGIIVRDPIRSMTIEYSVYVPAYDMNGHSGRFENEIDRQSVEAIYRSAMPIMRDVFWAHLEDADKILVYRSINKHPLEEVDELVHLLRSVGDNTLLWVTDGGGVNSPPTWLKEGLLHATLSRMTRYGNAGEVATLDDLYEAWLSLCRNTVSLIASSK